MSDINQIKNNIKEELEKVKPSRRQILSHLFCLRIYEEGLEYAPKDQWRYLPATEFFDIVAETFKLNPEFYMKHLYLKVRIKLRKDMNKRRKSRGISFRDSVREFKEKGFVGNLVDMDRYIFEKSCLNDGERILLESGGSIRCGGVIVSGPLYVTNNRIIVLGFLIALSYTLGQTKIKRITNFSIQQKCYGYIFPIKKLSNLLKRSKGASYNAELNGFAMHIKIIIAKIPNREEHINKIFELLSKHSKEEVRYQG